MPDDPSEVSPGGMLRRCAWCGFGIDADGGAVAEPSGDGAGPVSHGLCRPCERRLVADLGIPIHRFLEGLDTPVTLVEPDTPTLLVDVEDGGRVTSANRSALGSIGRNETPGDRPLVGEVFECANASLPGGCGRTVHCSACAIRRSLEETWESGRPLDRIPATLKPVDGDPDGQVELEISTRRVGERVLLTVHRIGRRQQED